MATHQKPKVRAPKVNLDSSLAKRIHNLMVKSRVLEDRLIKIYKAGDAYFWIGGPGEEAFGVCLGLLVNKGRGIDHDFLHLHYRCTPTLIAMGMTMLDSVRLIMNRATDPSTGGRNFSNHYCFPDWNVVPVSSPIEVQYSMAIGTAYAQSRSKKSGITVVTGGDAGTAEGDFASCLVWASRPIRPLPMLITVQNNSWGISTKYDGQHGEASIADRARAFQIDATVINGNDPVESYHVLQDKMSLIRRERRPVMIEAHVSRLYGHSSASGASRNDDFDPVIQFEELLLRAGTLTSAAAKRIWEEYEAEGIAAQNQARAEAAPTPDSIWQNIWHDNDNADWRRF